MLSKKISTLSAILLIATVFNISPSKAHAAIDYNGISSHEAGMFVYNTATTTNGNYVFSKAIVTAYNYETKAEVFTHVFNKTDSLEKLNNLPFPTQPVFLSATIQDGVLTFCKLWNTGFDYSVIENGKLLIPSKPSDSERTEENFHPFSQPYYLSPIYKLELDGNTATFTFTEPYGSGAYSFPLEGKFVIIMTREETK